MGQKASRRLKPHYPLQANPPPSTPAQERGDTAHGSPRSRETTTGTPDSINTSDRIVTQG